MSEFAESYKELESIKDSQEYKDFKEKAMHISNLGVATAVIGGILHRWCFEHDKNLMDALVLMGTSHIEAKELSKKLRGLSE